MRRRSVVLQYLREFHRASTSTAGTKPAPGSAVAGLLWRHVPIDTGGVVGSYVLGKRLGAGGMGVVYEATSGDTPVAIKLPYCETLDDAQAARRFRGEGIA